MEVAQLATVLCFGPPLLAAIVNLAAKKPEKYGAVIVTVSLAISTASSSALFAFIVSTGSVPSLEVFLLPPIGARFSLRVDALSSVFLLLVSAVSVLIAVYSAWYMRGMVKPARYWFFCGTLVGTACLLLLADDLIFFLLAWKGLSVASLALAWDELAGAENGTATFAASPPYRPFITLVMGDLALVIGLALLYLASGSSRLSELALSGDWPTTLALRGLLAPALIAILATALIRGAQIPFSEWFLTTRPHLVPAIALLQSVAVISASTYLAARFVSVAYAACELAGTLTDLLLPLSIVAIVGGLTVLLGGLQALASDRFELILAYATASQLGYAFTAIALGGLSGQVELGVLASVIIAVSVALFMSALFLAIGNVIHAVGLLSIDAYGGLSGMMKFTALSALLAICSLIGLFPFAGFWGKVIALSLSLASSLPLAVLLFGGVVVTVLYSSRLFLRVFMMEMSEEVEKLVSRETPPGDPNVFGVVPPLALAAGSLALGGLAFALLPLFASAVTVTIPGMQRFEYAMLADPSLPIFLVIVAVYGGGAMFFLYAMDAKVLRRLTAGFLSPLYFFLRSGLSAYPLARLAASSAFRATVVLGKLTEGALEGLLHTVIPLVISEASRALKSAEESVDRAVHVTFPSLVKALVTLLYSVLLKTLKRLKSRS